MGEEGARGHGRPAAAAGARAQRTDRGKERKGGGDADDEEGGVAQEGAQGAGAVEGRAVGIGLVLQLAWRGGVSVALRLALARMRTEEEVDGVLALAVVEVIEDVAAEGIEAVLEGAFLGATARPREVGLRGRRGW